MDTALLVHSDFSYFLNHTNLCPDEATTGGLDTDDGMSDGATTGGLDTDDGVWPDDNNYFFHRTDADHETTDDFDQDALQVADMCTDELDDSPTIPALVLDTKRRNTIRRYNRANNISYSVRGRPKKGLGAVTSQSELARQRKCYLEKKEADSLPVLTPEDQEKFLRVLQSKQGHLKYGLVAQVLSTNKIAGRCLQGYEQSFLGNRC